MIENLSQLKNTLSKCRGTWAWLGQRGIDAYTVADFIFIDTVFCCDFGEEYSKLCAKNSLFSVERNCENRKNWGNLDLEKLWEEPILKQIETCIDKLKLPINTVCYRSLLNLEKDVRFRVLAPSLALKDMFDNKLDQLELFSRLEIKTPITFVCRLNETTFIEAGDILGGPFVVQPPIGSSGENTYIINNESDFDRAKKVLGSAHRMKLSKYMPLPSLNGHCVVLNTGEGLKAIAACPSVQITGACGCADRPEIYCGNDFSAAGKIDKSLLKKVCIIMEKTGLFMGKKGFLGVFGMDFLLNGDEVLALEINPRFQGSTMLLSLLQADRGEIPLVALHVMQHMGLIQAFSQKFLLKLAKMYRNPYSGAHLILHNLKGTTCTIKHNLKAGIYILLDNDLKWVRSGTTCRDVQNPKEWCILGNLPSPNSGIGENARLAMIQTTGSILDNNLQQLEPYAATFVKKIQNCCRMTPFYGGRR